MEEVERSIKSYEKPSKLFNITKRTIDITGAILGLVLISPLFIIISILYMYGEAKGPVFFKQIRIGEYGKKFHIYKFRSMLMNAEEKLKSDNNLYKKYVENNYKLEPNEDPRITKLGQFLRSTSLDEIPQLINVIKGDMSLVGPRPVVEEELKEYGAKKSILLSVKPGITGYWQVSGRSNIGYPDRVDLELHYVYEQSLKLDFVILIRTVVQVLLKKGAY
ncbi:sugar transferase [Metabacillus bambusae]|uniref:Sugar transferase n=1 Tax=Metabacillus bambusae TaxID=2795218 RepID=A0ABS3N1V8_9BACI|nr:sugar transferase [Metabacillus bambusae]MBO1511898.1 sugar transferase [Metabacillus bambusae]